jgi:predicted DNA-binding protein (MmcQ/YjbR family)
LKKRTFRAELLGGHKGEAILVPFDPEEVWGIRPRTVASKTYGGRPGHLVRGTLNGHPFDGWIGRRWRKFFLLVDGDLQRKARVREGEVVTVAVAPRPDGSRARPRRPRLAARSQSADLRSVSRELRRFALALPGATEHFPWGERVAKVNGKVFVFLGGDPVPGGTMGLSVKLSDSGRDALDLPFAKPTGYGLGKAGWVSANFEAGDRPPVEILKTWILESYRSIAPKKLLARLDSAER